MIRPPFKKIDSDGRLLSRVHIVASPFKTGSTSVGEALKIMCVGTRMMRYKGHILKEIAPLSGSLNLLADEFEDYHNFETLYGEKVTQDLAPLVRAIKHFDIFHDAPFGHTHLHPFIRKALAPKACFIWVNRKRTDWLASVRKWEERHPDLYSGDLNWQEDPNGRAEKHLRMWSKQLKRFRQLRNAFPQDCVELGWNDLQNFQALAHFYGVSAPQVPFPNSNVSQVATASSKRFPRIINAGKMIADRAPVLEETLIKIHSLLRRKH